MKHGLPAEELTSVLAFGKEVTVKIFGLDKYECNAGICS